MIEFDPRSVAAHELGHALVFMESGAKIDRITLSADGGGWTAIARCELETDTQARLYAAGIMAGRVAGDRWRGDVGMPPEPGSCTVTDRALWQTWANDYPELELVESESESLAHDVLTGLWSHLLGLVDELVDRGWLYGVELF